MAKQRHLDHAPIVEAVIDLRAELPATVTGETFERLRGRLVGYPNVEDLKMAHTNLTFDSGTVTPTTTQMQLGLGFRSADRLNVAQFRVNGFTFNRLAPYTRWEAIFPETMRLWREYVTVAQPARVVRLAARYINQMRFPQPVTDLGFYLNAPPRVPDGVPEELRSFLTRLVVHDRNRNLSAIVTQAFEPIPDDPEHVVILLDIDAYVEPARGFEPDEPRIESVLDTLHIFKNEIFFNSITEDAARLFE